MEVADVEEARESSGKRWATGEEGQGLVEYALVLLMVAIALAAALGALGTELDRWYRVIASAIP